MVEELTGKKQQFTYLDENRVGDHICYYSDLRKMKTQYPKWTITRPLKTIFQEIVGSWQNRLSHTA